MIILLLEKALNTHPWLLQTFAKIIAVLACFLTNSPILTFKKQEKMGLSCCGYLAKSLVLFCRLPLEKVQFSDLWEDQRESWGKEPQCQSAWYHPYWGRGFYPADCHKATQNCCLKRKKYTLSDLLNLVQDFLDSFLKQLLSSSHLYKKIQRTIFENKWVLE